MCNARFFLSVISFVLSLWWGENLDSNWIIKHALRSLLKAQNKQALKIVGINSTSAKGKVSLKNKKVKLGSELIYVVEIKTKSATLVRIDVILHFVRNKKGHGKKVFKIMEKEIKGIHQFEKRLTFKKMTTRKHKKGHHKIELIVNGLSQSTQTFEII